MSAAGADAGAKGRRLDPTALGDANAMPLRLPTVLPVPPKRALCCDCVLGGEEAYRQEAVGGERTHLPDQFDAVHSRHVETLGRMVAESSTGNRVFNIRVCFPVGGDRRQ